LSLTNQTVPDEAHWRPVDVISNENKLKTKQVSDIEILQFLKAR
jgi:hypothetical protein